MYVYYVLTIVPVSNFLGHIIQLIPTIFGRHNCETNIILFAICCALINNMVIIICFAVPQIRSIICSIIWILYNSVRRVNIHDAARVRCSGKHDQSVAPLRQRVIFSVIRRAKIAPHFNGHTRLRYCFIAIVYAKDVDFNADMSRRRLCDRVVGSLSRRSSSHNRRIERTALPVRPALGGLWVAGAALFFHRVLRRGDRGIFRECQIFILGRRIAGKRQRAGKYHADNQGQTND